MSMVVLPAPAVERYVRESGFSKEDYLFESMCYAYHRF